MGWARLMPSVAIAKPSEICERSQPNSACSGRKNTPKVTDRMGPKCTARPAAAAITTHQP